MSKEEILAENDRLNDMLEKCSVAHDELEQQLAEKDERIQFLERQLAKIHTLSF